MGMIIASEQTARKYTQIFDFDISIYELGHQRQVESQTN